MVIVKYKKSFIDGTLEGLEFDDQLHFVNERAAGDFIEKVMAPGAVFGGPGFGSKYEVVQAQIVPVLVNFDDEEIL